jgi:hypothetical protein
VVSVTPRPLSTRGKELVPIVQEVGWASGPVWTGAENLVPTRLQWPRGFQEVKVPRLHDNGTFSVKYRDIIRTHPNELASTILEAE